MNTIQKSLVLGGMGAVIIILSYLIALSEIELSINIPAMVAPTSISEKRVVPENSAELILEDSIKGDMVFCDSFVCLTSALESCEKNRIIKLTLKEELKEVENVMVDYNAIFKINGVDDLGNCVVNQAVFDANTIASATSSPMLANTLDLYMISVANASAICTGQGSDLSDYFYDSIFDIDNSVEKLVLSLTETGSKIVYEDKVTCIASPYHGLTVIDYTSSPSLDLTREDTPVLSAQDYIELSENNCASIACLEESISSCQPGDGVINYTRFLPLGIVSLNIVSRFEVLGLDESGSCKISEMLLGYDVFLTEAQKDSIRLMEASGESEKNAQDLLAEIEESIFKYNSTQFDLNNEIVEYSGANEDLFAYFKGLATKQSVSPSLLAPYGDFASMIDYNISFSFVE